MTRHETRVALYASAVGGIVAARERRQALLRVSVGKKAADIANATFNYLTSTQHEEMVNDEGYGKQQLIEELNAQVAQLKEQIILE